MARSSGTHTTNAGTGKRLAKPILPALPLLPRPKKEPAKFKEENKAVKGVGTSRPQTKVEPEVHPQPQPSTPVVEEKVSEQDTKGPDGNNHVDARLESVSDLNGLRTIPVLIEPETPASHNAKNSVTPPESLKAESEIQVARDTLIDTPSSRVSSMRDHLQDARLDSDEMFLAHKVPSTSDVAPEAVTGDVEKAKSVHHTTNESLDNSSVKITPQYIAAVPISPPSTGTVQQQAHANGTYQALPSASGLANGFSSPTAHGNVRNASVLSPGGQPNFPPILTHICNLQFLPDWFDCEICVYYSQSPKPAIYRSAHSLVLIRSERMRNFLYPQRAGNYSYYVINLAPARPIDANAFDAALRFLYTDTILSADRLLPPYAGLDKAGRVSAFNYIMSYMVAGLELGIEPVTTRSLDLIGRILDWDLAEQAVKEATLLRSYHQPAITPHAPLDSIVAARSILQHVFNLVILRLDARQFKLDTASTPVDMISRFAQFESGRAPVNPALANMVFGSMPASANLSPALPHVASFEATASPDVVASVIMLNLEFEDLRNLAAGLKRVHGEEGKRVIGEVVEERERRRLQILNNRSVNNKQRVANSGMWDVIGLHEYVTDGVLHCERVGFAPPSKRGGNN